MTDTAFEIRTYRDADYDDVLALWENVFPDARAWNQPVINARGGERSVMNGAAKLARDVERVYVEASPG